MSDKYYDGYMYMTSRYMFFIVTTTNYTVILITKINIIYTKDITL